MKTRNTNSRAAILSPAFTAAALLSCAAVLTLASPALAGVGNAGNPGIIPPQASAHGNTYGEWGALWWRWALSIPPEQNPVADETGEFAAIGQSGSVWFLAGNFGGTTERTVRIPPGKALFFPIINTGWITTCNGEPRTIADALPYVQPFVDAAEGLGVSIDGVAVQNLDQYRASTPLFCTSMALYGINTVEDMLASGFCGSVEDYNLNCTDLPNPDEHFGPTDGFGPSIADGYWLMVAPLPVGQHTIHITATSGDFSLDVTYYLTVK